MKHSRRIFFRAVFIAAILPVTHAFGQTSAGAASDKGVAGWLEHPAFLALAALLVVVIVYFGVRFLSRQSRPYERVFEDTHGDYGVAEPRPPKQARPHIPIMHARVDERTDTIIAPAGLPPDLDVPRFLRKAKGTFMRLQASWDNADVKDIRRFTSRDLHAEFCKQLEERGQAPNFTEVLTLGAELTNVDTVGEYYIATVKFTGKIKDAPNARPAPFSEVWRLSKPLDGRRSWLLAGIDQY